MIEAVASLPLSLRTAERGVTVRECRTFDDWRALEPRWNTLLERSPRPCLYLTYEWLTTWWQCHGGGERELYVLAVSDGTELIGVAPFMKVRKHRFGVPVVKIEFVSMVQEASSVRNSSASLDILAPIRPRDVVRAIGAHLTRDPDWHYLRLHPVSESSPVLGALRDEMARRRCPLVQRFAFHNAWLPTEGGWTDYRQRLSRRLRKAVRNATHRLERLGPVTVTSLRAAPDPQTLYGQILALERRSWKSSAGLAIDDRAYRGFYRRMLVIAAQRGWLRLWLLRVGDRAIAYDYAIEYGGSVEVLKGSYDEAFRRYSVGQVLMMRELEECFGSPAERVNLLWGSPDYKMQWASHLEPHVELYVFHTTRFARLLHALYIRSSLHELGRFLARQSDRLAWALSRWRHERPAPRLPE